MTEPEAPEESYALSPSIDSGPAVREPAPAGAFQRAAQFRAMEAEAAGGEEAYFPRRGTLSFRLRTAIPRGVAGRIILGSAALFVLGAAVVAVVGVRKYLTHDDRFTIATSSEIEIDGNRHLTRGQLLSVFGADLERNIFKVPLAERRADLERLPWVAHATVMRLLPNHLRIALVERTPVAFVRQGTELGLVDAGGVLLDMPPDSAGDPLYSFPVLTGLSAADPLSVRAARMAVYAKFMQDLGVGGKAVTDSLSEVDVSNPEDVKAVIASGGHDVLVHFGDRDFLHRFQEFKQHLPEWLGQYPKLASADMTFDRQIVLEMAPGVAAPAVDAGDASVAGTVSVAGTPSTAGKAAAASKVVAAAPVAPVVPVSPAKISKTKPARAHAAKVSSAKASAAGETAAIKAELALARAAGPRRAAPVVGGGNR